jgi:hypothetical protein
MYANPRKSERNYLGDQENPAQKDYHNEMLTYYRKATVDARVLLLREAYLMMQNVLSADEHTQEGLKSIVFTAKKIGGLGIAIENYLKEGGSLSTAKNPFHTFTIDKETWEATGKG